MPGNPLLTEEEKARFRWSPEMNERSGITKQLVTPTDIGEQQALDLIEQKLDDRHFTLLLNETGMVETQDPDSGFVHGPLCILLKNRLSKSFLDKVRPIIRKAARQSVAGGNRGDAAGTGMVPRKRKDGSTSKIKGVPKLKDLGDEDYKRLLPAKDGTIFFNGRDTRGGQVYGCRLTMYSGALPSELRLMAELAQQVGEAFRQSWVCDLWEAQFEKASQTPPAFLIKTRDGHTPFTTITCNKSYRTAAHVDKGDLKAGFGVMCCLGDFEGCDLVFPRYKTAVRYREGDILLANVHQVHGNTPLLNPDGTVPELGKEPERLVCVFYYQEDMDQCMNSVREELDFINGRKPGDPIHPNKRKSKS